MTAPTQADHKLAATLTRGEGDWPDVEAVVEFRIAAEQAMVARIVAWLRDSDGNMTADTFADWIEEEFGA